MLYPKVIEIARTEPAPPKPPVSQRELVEASLRSVPRRDGAPAGEHPQSRGIFR